MHADLEAAGGAFLDALRGCCDAQPCEPNRLPGWSRGHVVSHVVLNAEGFAEVARQLRAGTPAFVDVDLEHVQPVDPQPCS